MPDKSTGDRTFVVFLDSFGPDDIEQTNYIQNEMASYGTLDAGVPRVTPAVLASIYTGLGPAETGLPAIQRYGAERRFRPDQFTLPEMAALGDTYDSVLNYHLPFSAVPPRKDPDDTFWSIAGAMGNKKLGPQDAAGLLQLAGPAGDLKDGDPPATFNLNVDYTESMFTQFRQIMESQDFDLGFIGYRLLDSYTHWQRTLTRESTGELMRDDLIGAVDKQVYILSQLGDVFLFGDHGSVPMTDVMRINRWLIDNGYLEVNIDWDWIDRSEKAGVIEGEDHPVDEALPNQLNWHHPGVEVDESRSVAISGDPFWSGLTLLDGANQVERENLKRDLMNTGCFADVYDRGELFNPDAAHFELAPDIIPDQREGVYVTGNLHPYPIGAGYMRSGVHGQTGAWASTRQLESAGLEVDPIGLHTIIRDEFLGLDEYVPFENGVDKLSPAEQERLVEHIQGDT